MIFASFKFKSNVPSSALAVEVAPKQSTVQRMLTAPLIAIGSSVRGRLPRKKYPAAQLCAFGALKYDASKCTLRIMSDA
jgi:hypothetical protein